MSEKLTTKKRCSSCEGMGFFPCSGAHLKSQCVDCFGTGIDPQFFAQCIAELKADNEKLNIALTDSVVRDVELMQANALLDEMRSAWAAGIQYDNWQANYNKREQT